MAREESEYDKHLHKIKEGEHPKEQPGGMHDDAIYTHPAYASISASRVSGGRLLFGSDFEHQHFVTISIHRAQVHRGLSRDWTNSKEELIQVALSEAQWATFVSTLNSGGTECTLEHLGGKLVPWIASKPERTTQFGKELRARIKDAIDAAEAIKKEIDGANRKTVLREHMHSIQGLANSLEFIADQFGEHMEETTEKAKIEVAAYIDRLIHRTGLKALGATPPINMITDKREPK